MSNNEATAEDVYDWSQNDEGLYNLVNKCFSRWRVEGVVQEVIDHFNAAAQEFGHLQYTGPVSNVVDEICKWEKIEV